MRVRTCRPLRVRFSIMVVPATGFPIGQDTDVPIEVVDYHKSYDSVIAVEGLSFSVRPGEILGLLGPNGAGTTTTMRAITGIIPPTRGQLRVAGIDVVANP